MSRMEIKVIYQSPSRLVLSELNAIQLAASIEGEGTVGIEKQRTAGRVGYSHYVEIGNTNIKLRNG
jgi:hypothetical protein